MELEAIRLSFEGGLRIISRAVAFGLSRLVQFHTRGAVSQNVPMMYKWIQSYKLLCNYLDFIPLGQYEELSQIKDQDTTATCQALDPLRLEAIHKGAPI